jgi:hypothetical protein
MTTRPGRIFISYAREDEARAHQFRRALTLALGTAPWCDVQLAVGDRWRDELEQQLREAACVAVLWSEHACKSDWVKAEAAAAKMRHALMSVVLDLECAIPKPFDDIQAVNMHGWSGSESDPQFVKLAAELRERARPFAASIESLRDGDACRANVPVFGRFERLPPGHQLYLINSPGGDSDFYPQISKRIELDEHKGTWRGSTHVNSDTHVVLVSVSPAALKLIDYYQKVGAGFPPRYVGIDQLPGEPDVRVYAKVFVRCR